MYLMPCSDVMSLIPKEVKSLLRKICFSVIDTGNSEDTIIVKSVGEVAFSPPFFLRLPALAQC